MMKRESKKTRMSPSILKKTREKRMRVRATMVMKLMMIIKRRLPILV
jgi:hypothetical protein